jgi:hypothetical protein
LRILRGELHSQFPETGFASQVFSLEGKSEALISGMPISIHRDRSIVISPRETLNVTNDAGYGRLVLWMDAAALTCELSAITGQTCCRRCDSHTVMLLYANRHYYSH